MCRHFMVFHQLKAVLFHRLVDGCRALSCVPDRIWNAPVSHTWHHIDADCQLGVRGHEGFEDVGGVFAAGNAVQRGAYGAALAFEDVAVFAGGHGVLPEDFFAAFDVADELGGVVFVFEDELAELHVVEVDVAFADVEEVDAGLRAVLAVEDDLDFGPVLVAADFGRGLGAADVVVEAGLAAEGVGLDPGAELVFRVRLQRHVGEETGVGIIAGDDAEGLLAAVDHLLIGDDAPFGPGIAGLRAVVALLPTGRCFSPCHHFFKAAVRQQIRAFLVVQRLVFLAQHLGGFGQPFVILHHRINGELFHQRLDLWRGGEVRELHESGEACMQIGIADDAGAEEQGLRFGIAAEGANGIAAQFGIFGDEGGLMGFGVKDAKGMLSPQIMGPIGRIRLIGLIFNDYTLSHQTPILRGSSLRHSLPHNPINPPTAMIP